MLRLRIVSDHRASLGSRADKTLNTGDLTVGRGPENGWSLPDPDRLLSRQHCVFEKTGTQYRVIDTSTNGVFLNGAEQPLGRNAPAVLKGGDRIRIGRFIIEATIETLDAPSFTEIAGAFRGPGRGQGGAQDPGGANSFAAPFAVPPPPPMPAFDFDDPPAADRAMPGDPPAFPAWPPGTPVAGGEAIGEDWRFGAVDDHAAAVNQALRVMASEPAREPVGEPFREDPGGEAVQPAPSSLIPDDWDDPSFSLGHHPAAVSDAPVAPSASALPLPEDWNLDDTLADEAAPSIPPPMAAFVPAPMPTPVSAPFPGPEPSPVSVPKSSVEPATPPTAAAVAAFLAGFGAPPPSGGVADGEGFLRSMGEALRISLGALHASLQARAHFKDEFHLEQTSFRPAGENPLKRCADLDAAVAVLADPGRRGFLPMADAVREAAGDVQVHHLAYAAALQTALKQVVAKFDPQALSQRLETRLIDSLAPALRKARYWDQYEALYKDLVVELTEDFDRAVGDAITAEYDRHVRSEAGRKDGGDPA